MPNLHNLISLGVVLVEIKTLLFNNYSKVFKLLFRCEGFVFGHVADEGYMDSCAGSLLRYRKNIGAENVQVYCDIKKKHRYYIFELLNYELTLTLSTF